MIDNLPKEPDFYGGMEYQGPKMIGKKRNKKAKKKDLAPSPPPPLPLWYPYPEKTSYDDDDRPCEPEAVMAYNATPKEVESPLACNTPAVNDKESVVEKDGECEVIVGDIRKTIDWDYIAPEEPAKEKSPTDDRPWTEEKTSAKEEESGTVNEE
ncbi:hypothetical protein F53441_14313, partial [Fusarium austroafricanum]